MESTSKRGPGTRAVLVGIQLPGVTGAELRSSLDELGRLAKTLGLECVARVTQPRQGTQTTTVLGAGKLVELAKLTGGTGVVPLGASKRRTGAMPGGGDDDDDEPEVAAPDDADEADGPGEGDGAGDADRAGLVLFDHDLTPSQIRNLEGATSAQVLDRTSVILAIFQRHARTREARIQVEIARLTYMAPRLRATGGGGDRQRGGIGGKGAGESALELDRRRVRDRIAELRQELLAAQRETDLRRSRRAKSDTVALVGYTNAGKSSLMRGLTGSEVLVRDQLFATLDTTIRRLTPPTKPPVLVSDTVGFIKKLPHDLVASFRSTLEEARDAALLLYVVDAADPAWRDQLDVTHAVLADLEAGNVPSLLVLNKVDRLDAAAREALAAEQPDALLLSAHDPADVATLHGRITAFFERDMIDAELHIDYRSPRLVHRIHEACRVLSEEHGEEGTVLRVRALPAFVDEVVAAGARRVG